MDMPYNGNTKMVCNRWNSRTQSSHDDHEDVGPIHAPSGAFRCRRKESLRLKDFMHPPAIALPSRRWTAPAYSGTSSTGTAQQTVSVLPECVFTCRCMSPLRRVWYEQLEQNHVSPRRTGSLISSAAICLLRGAVGWTRPLGKVIEELGTGLTDLYALERTRPTRGAVLPPRWRFEPCAERVTVMN